MPVHSLRIQSVRIHWARNVRVLCGALVVLLATAPAYAQLPADTQPLTVDGDIASLMVDGIDTFLLKQIAQARQNRQRFWNYNTTSAEAFNESVQPNRERLKHILGLRDPRVPFASPELVVTVSQSNPVVATGRNFKVYAIRWPVLADPAPTAQHLPSIYGAGLLLVPDQPAIANVVALPDVQHSPEQIAGLVEGVPPASQFARRLAECGCRVVVPTLINRDFSQRNGRANISNREYLYRSSFELGRHMIGYELQKVLAIVDWFEKDSSAANVQTGIIGYGEGGLLSLYAGALDTRIDTVCVSGAFGPREECWNEPLDRNVFGLLKEFGGSQLGILVQPRKLIIDVTNVPQVSLSGDGGGGPAELRTPSTDAVRAEADEVADLAATFQIPSEDRQGVTTVFGDTEQFCRDATGVFLNSVSRNRGDASRLKASEQNTSVNVLAQWADEIPVRQQQQLEEIDRHNQALLRESPFVRKAFLKNLDTSSVAAYEKSIESYRRIFRDDVIGEFDLPLLPFNARSRQSWDTEKWTGHEVMLDVFPDVFAYGVLLVPKDLKPGEKRPVVVCQHGLEGRPTDTFLDDHRAYHDFAAKLCEQGYITFAPQNPYIFKDRFRTLQRKANPLGRTLFSIIVPQHQQIVNWLKTQPHVDPDRIGFYGLSYGGKSAMRIPALVTDYALSICSADFNEWVLKNATTRENFSYMWTGEYEIFEWDLGSTFNYAEMAALICPRPFMVERGHFDGVGEDEWVGFEFAKVRRLYAAQLKIPERTEIEWFVGPHTINGQGTFRFLDRHLKGSR
ncbi:MAG: hypothetical protein R3C59_25860 [Planctomycetaceae bacterium]